MMKGKSFWVNLKYKITLIKLKIIYVLKAHVIQISKKHVFSYNCCINAMGRNFYDARLVFLHDFKNLSKTLIGILKSIHFEVPCDSDFEINLVRKMSETF